MNKFEVISTYKPSGDQPKAIDELTEGLNNNTKHQILLGVTGSGKTFTISNVIANCNRPTLIISPNKTLAAQLFSEFKSFFPNNVVEFFISYYDYYQPEAYMASRDVYIEKDFSINDEIDRLRLRATTALIEGRRDVIIIASVSCIYGIGAPDEYAARIIFLHKGQTLNKKDFIENLINIFYNRNDMEFTRGAFRVRGDVVEVIPAYERDEAIRVEFWDDEIENISLIDSITGDVIKKVDSIALYPAKYFVSSDSQVQKALRGIKAELKSRLEELYKEEKYVEAQRLEQRTNFDLEMIKEIGYCSGIENYSGHLDGRTPGTRSHCLLDYFPKDFLLIIDESHITLSQIQAMYKGDKARKQTLVDYGFRLPSALDNRPMKFNEFENVLNQVIFVSATPGDYELEQTKGRFIEQIIRPTGLLDPNIEVRPIDNQIDDLINEIRLRLVKQERVLVTTLTKRMAEDLCDYLSKIGIMVKYIHSDVDSLERVEIIRNLRLGQFDVLIGVNLLREGLDLPEVSLVAVLDADKEGFLRSIRSLMQIAGRTARNVNGLVIMYANRITKSMQFVIDETERRRNIQIQYNKENNITPKTVFKSVEEILASTSIADVRKKDTYIADNTMEKVSESVVRYMTKDQKEDLISQLQLEMHNAAKDFEFEKAAFYRDEIERIKKSTK